LKDRDKWVVDICFDSEMISVTCQNYLYTSLLLDRRTEIVDGL
jgi:hypothetical protein